MGTKGIEPLTSAHSVFLLHLDAIVDAIDAKNAAMPSSLPAKPNFSVVVALIFI